METSKKVSIAGFAKVSFGPPLRTKGKTRTFEKVFPLIL